jgi:hypothetical protein
VLASSVARSADDKRRQHRPASLSYNPLGRYRHATTDPPALSQPSAPPARRHATAPRASNDDLMLRSCRATPWCDLSVTFRARAPDLLDAYTFVTPDLIRGSAS